MYCPKCGKPNAADAKFCTGCGNPLTAASFQNGPACAQAEPRNGKPAADPEKSSALGIIALIMAFLFPVIGLILGLIDYNTKDGYSKNFAKWAMIAAGIVFALRIVCNALLSAFVTNRLMDFFIRFM